MMVRSGIAAFSTGTRVCSGAFGDDEAADVLRQMPRRIEQLRGDHQHAPHHRAVGIEAALAQAFVQLGASPSHQASERG